MFLRSNLQFLDHSYFLAVYKLTRDSSTRINTMDDPEAYTKSQEYWSDVPPTVDGMLGGLAKVSPADINLSERVLRSYLHRWGNPLVLHRLLEIGAGIGRITKHLLSKYCSDIHLLESNEKFLQAAPRYLGTKVASKVSNYITLPLQDFYPEVEYDCIWCQWVLAYLKDEDLINALKRLKSSLRKDSNGLIFIKENISKDEDSFDEADCSVTRTREHFLEIFRKAELELIEEHLQSDFPKNLLQVRLFVLR